MTPQLQKRAREADNHCRYHRELRNLEPSIHKWEPLEPTPENIPVVIERIRLIFDGPDRGLAGLEVAHNARALADELEDYAKALAKKEKANAKR
jgi:hypothetical protein